MNPPHNQVGVCLLILASSFVATRLFASEPPVTSRFIYNGVTAHRGDSGKHPENSMDAFASGIEVGADWLELDIFRSSDGQIVVTHDRTTARVGDQSLMVVEATYEQLSRVDVATDFRRRTGRTLAECPPQRMPLLKEVLELVIKQDRTRVSIQPKMDCVPEAIAIIRELGAETWCGFNDGNLELMSQVKQLAPEIPVFWDRRPDTDLVEDIRIATDRGFEALVVHHTGLTSERVAMIKEAGLEAGAWTVNDPAVMEELLEMGIERIYTDYPQELLAIQAKQSEASSVVCEGTYAKHLQGICVDEQHIYWSFTTTLVKTDRQGKRLAQVAVADHHGDLCLLDGKLYVAVNLGEFNNPEGKADNWLYVYAADTLNEIARYPLPHVTYGAGGVGTRDGHLFIVGGLPPGIEENYVYEYDLKGRHLATHALTSGYTKMGIQTATYADGEWWFGCYGEPRILLIVDADWKGIRRIEFDCSLGIAGLSDGRLMVASGECGPNACSGKVRSIPRRKLDR